MNDNDRAYNKLSNDVNFHLWFDQLLLVHPCPTLDKGCWRDYFDEGYTPEEAAIEDMSCGY